MKKYSILDFNGNYIADLIWQDGILTYRGDNRFGKVRLKKEIENIEADGLYVRKSIREEKTIRELSAKKEIRDEEYLQLLLEQLVLRQYIIKKSED